MIKNHLRWFRHEQRVSLEELVRSVDWEVWYPLKRDRGKPERTFNEVMEKDLLVDNLSKYLIVDLAQ